MNNGDASTLTVKPNSFKAWWLAARPKTLTGAIAPVLVGGSMAFSMMKTQAIGTKWLDVLIPFLLCLLFAVVMQIDANFINDYFDFKKGTDRTDRLGPERACAQGWITPHAMRIGIGITTFISCLIGIAILLWNIQLELIIVGLLCVIFCFLYTTRLSYLGWGDLLVLIFFGLIPVVFTCYVMTNGNWNVPLVIAGLAMGLATDNLLMVNNYRDRHQDKVSGKLTIVVRIMEAQTKRLGIEAGTRKAEKIIRNIYLWIGIFATLLSAISFAILPLSGMRYLLMLIYLILHFRAFRQLNTLDGRDLNKLLATTASNIFLFGLLFAVGMCL